ncbi:hypothetical protein AA15973_2082 [Komagataeibacter sucrofermentans DSM 15973]|nr:hypothetical protein AA15973_2082 [Komagataeibacter sucrofermentans DSM 15973]
MALALGKQGYKHVGPGHLVAPGGLHVNGRALNYALESGRGLGVNGAVGREACEILVKKIGQVGAQLVQIDPAGAEYRYGIRVIDQREEEVFKRCVFVPAVASQCQRTVKRLFKIT